MVTSTRHPRSSWWRRVKRHQIRPRPLWSRPEVEGLESRLAPSAHLVKDINTAPAAPSDDRADISQLTAVGSTLFFTARDVSHGIELWKSDGTATGTVLVKVVCPGTVDERPHQLTNVNGTLYFTIDNGEHGHQLWKSDSTQDGTVLVKDMWADGLTAVNSTLFFMGRDPEHGEELWKSDGTPEGTALVKDIWPGTNGSDPGCLTAINGTLFLVASTPGHGPELWKSDSTAAGTVLVKDIWPGTNGSSPAEPCNVNGTLFFSASDPEHGPELWQSDGTADGTVLVKDIWPGTDGSYLSNLTNVNGTLFFTAHDPEHGAEIWKSDGTANGTVLVKDIWPGPLSSVSYGSSTLTHVNGTLFFTASDPAYGEELWKSDGSADGTVLVKDIWPGMEGSEPSNLTSVNGSLFFKAHDPEHGEELWKSDGTDTGTVLVKELWPGTDWSDPHPSNLTNVNGTLFFVASDPEHGEGLWKSDGTADGTVLVKDTWPGTGNSRGKVEEYDPYFFMTNVNGTLFFDAGEPEHGVELWKSDGSAAGTILVKDIWPGADSSWPTWMTAVNGTLFFLGSDPEHRGGKLWKSDGTAGGTVLVKDIGPNYPTDVNGMLFFTADDGEHGVELWKSDGTVAGTVLVKDIWPGPESSLAYTTSYLTNVHGTLFFTARDPGHGRELWKSDGTAAGTALVKDIWPGTEGPYPSNLTDVNGSLFFTVSDPAHGWELWKSDGTEAGTTFVKGIWPDDDYGRGPSHLTAVNGTLFFTAYEPEHGRELWKSDGTEAGTTLVKDIWPGWAGSDPSNLTAVNDRLFFTARDPENGNELWKSDGTVAGTVLVKNINPSSGDSWLSDLTAVNGTLFFATFDADGGTELWQSDGSRDGSVLVRDILPDAHWSVDKLPFDLTNVNGTLYFTADDGVHGAELWRTTLDFLPAKLSSPAAVGSAYRLTFSANSGTMPYTFRVSTGSLPAGLTLDTSGLLHGTPTAGGAFALTITVTDASGDSASRDYTLTVARPTIVLAPAALPRSTYGAAYSQKVTASGGTAPYTFTVTAGALPPGLSLTADGRLRGTPALAGSYSFTISARDSSTGTGPYSASRAYAMTVNKAVLTVRADAKGRLYLAANPPLTYTITDFVNGDSLVSGGVRGRPVLTTMAARRSPAGGYPITVTLGTLTARNYAFKLVGSTLTVRKSGWLFWQPGASANVPVYRIRTGG